ncbi:MAG: hypothetical protein ABR511_02665 [Acidimicrobiales bacterium]
MTSVVCGVVGLVLLVAGLVAGVEGLALAGVAAGLVSLVAALVWREQLIEAWRSRRAGNDEIA